MEPIKYAYLINSIEEYGKLIAFCIEHDISVFRSYWDEREKGKRAYFIDYENRRLLYSDHSYFEEEGYKIKIPEFILNDYGVYKYIR